MGIVGVLPIAKRQVKFLLVAIDYFTEWIVAEPLTKITVEQVRKFTLKNIICRHGLPYAVVTDNETQFAYQTFQTFCKQLGIKQHCSSVEHPQTNGQDGTANKVILSGLRKCLEEAKGAWAEELPKVLWTYHVTPQSAKKETPFKLTYGADAMIPVEVGETYLRRASFNPKTNDESLKAELDLKEELRETTHIKNATSKEKAERKYKIQAQTPRTQRR